MSERVDVLPVLRPDVDVEQLAAALMNLVESLPPEERDKIAELAEEPPS